MICRILKQESINNSPGSLTALSRRHPRALMVMEAGMQSPWTSRFLKEHGHRVLVWGDVLIKQPLPLPRPAPGVPLSAVR